MLIPFRHTPTPGPLDPEAQLIEQAKTDRHAFAALYNTHAEAIWNHLYWRTGDRHAADDLLAEVFLALLDGIGRYDCRGVPLRHWLLRTSTRMANHWLRKRGRRRTQSLDTPGADSAEAAHAQAGPDEQERARIQGVLRRLPEDQQAVLVLHYLEHLTLEQIALVLPCRLGTVKSRLYRARQAMRDMLEGSEGH